MHFLTRLPTALCRRPPHADAPLLLCCATPTGARHIASMDQASQSRETEAGRHDRVGGPTCRGESERKGTGWINLSMCNMSNGSEALCWSLGPRGLDRFDVVRVCCAAQTGSYTSVHPSSNVSPSSLDAASHTISSDTKTLPLRNEHLFVALVVPYTSRQRSLPSHHVPSLPSPYKGHLPPPLSNLPYYKPRSVWSRFSWEPPLPIPILCTTMNLAWPCTTAEI